jgi:hypothetical protein
MRLALATATLPGDQTLGLVPQQIVEFSLLGRGFELSEPPSETDLGNILGP